MVSPVRRHRHCGPVARTIHRRPRLPAVARIDVDLSAASHTRLVSRVRRGHRDGFPRKGGGGHGGELGGQDADDVDRGGRIPCGAVVRGPVNRATVGECGLGGGGIGRGDGAPVGGGCEGGAGDVGEGRAVVGGAEDEDC